ncbi:MAG TPA: glycosyltransferase, partial [Phycisphaerae bacterium]|nr:glycosyltransferase [Phycisphaerae bacterium]
GTVAELTALGVPAVLMPYPFHRDRHQEDHARILEEVGAAVAVRDQANPDRNMDGLWQVVPQLMEDDARREAMADAARRLGRPEAGKSIVSAIRVTLGR